VLSLREVRHQRGGRDVLILDRLDVWDGQRLAVLGPNGAGKTTLLRLLAAVDTPAGGSLEISGTPYDGLSSAEQQLLRRRIAYLSQRPALLNTTVARNVELPLAWRHVARPDRRRRALEALDRLGVAHLADRRTHTLSGGEAQRVALARALVTAPWILLLDEPAAALDARSREAFLTDLGRVLATDRSLSVVHVSHRPGEALRMADRVAVLIDGRVAQLGTPEEVMRAPAGGKVAGLVGYHNVLDVTVDADGHVRTGGAVLLTLPGASEGPGTLAVWAHGVRITPAQGLTPWKVTDVRAGPGHWDTLVEGTGDAAGSTLVAHLPLGQRQPHRADHVELSVTATDCALIPGV
jgi:ABC-type sulfate/molybdate transport systems ATPase subunit